MIDIVKTQRPYKRYGSAIRAWKSRRREVLLSGPAGTGKSRACLEKLHFCADKYAGMRGLIVRKTRTSLTQTALTTFEKHVLPDGCLGDILHFRTSEQEYRYPNGSVIAVGGLDKASKIMSAEFDMIYVQEATELLEEDWEALTTRLRNNVMPYQQLIADCNPTYPTHWLKLRADRGVTLLLESRHEDNPSVTPEYLATLDALTGVRKKRLRDGIWAAADGLVYEEWDPAIHKVSLAQLQAWRILTADERIDRTGTKRVIAGVDWGWTNPGYIGVNALDADDRLYLIHEVYRTQRTDDWWVEQGKALKARYGIEAFICDPAMPAYIAKFKAAGLNPIEADNDIAAGVNDFRERLHVAGDTRPRFYLYEYSLKEQDERRVEGHEPFCIDQEILEYVWPKAQDGKPIKELPVATNNHALDAERYVCRHLAGPTASASIAAVIARNERQQQREQEQRTPRMIVQPERKGYWQ